MLQLCADLVGYSKQWLAFSLTFNMTCAVECTVMPALQQLLGLGRALLDCLASFDTTDSKTPCFECH